MSLFMLRKLDFDLIMMLKMRSKFTDDHILRPPSLSELTPYKIKSGLNFLGLETSILSS